MNVIKYNVNSPSPCPIGRQYEYGKTRVVFEGYNIVDAANEIYFKFIGRTEDSKYLVPITDMTLDIEQYLTKHVGTFTCQLEEMNDEGTLVSQSALFRVVVKRSIKVGAEYEVIDPRLETIYQKYNAMYNTINETNNTVLENESQRQADWITLKQEVADAVASIDGKLDQYKASTTDALQLSLNGFIGEAEESIQTSLAAYELQTDTSLSNKLSAYQSKTTSNINRMFDDSNRTSKEKIDALASEIEQRRLAGEFNGYDGYSPSAKVEPTTGGVEITITDKSGTTKEKVLNGRDGADGNDYVITDADKDEIADNVKASVNADINELKSDLYELIDVVEPINKFNAKPGYYTEDTGSYRDYFVHTEIEVKEGDVLRFYNWKTTEGVTAYYPAKMLTIATYNNGVFSASPNSYNVSSFTVPSGINMARVGVNNEINKDVLLTVNTEYIPTTHQDYFDPYMDFDSEKFSNSLERNSEYIKETSVSAVNDYNDSFVDIDFSIPTFATVGHEIRFYHKNLISPTEEPHLIKNWQNSTDLNSGREFNDYSAIFVPTVTGNSNVTLQLFNERTKEKLVQKTINMNVVADNPSAKKVMFIGDSFTQQLYYPAKVHLLSNKHFELVGTMSHDIDIDGENIVVHHEGRGGWSISDYTTKADKGDVVNPFFNNSTFDFSYYATNNPNNIPNFVVICLGTNGDAGVENSISGLNTIISSIRNYNSNIKILLCLIPIGGISQPFISYNPLTSFREYAQKLNNNIVSNFNETIENVHLVPLFYHLDTEWDYAYTEKTVSAINPKTYIKHSTDVHPTKYGYYHMAEVIYSAILYYS